VIVEGHGDSTGTDEYNLELSQLRSGEVVKSALKTLQSAADPQVRETFPCFVRLLSASGRGRSELVTKNGVEDPEASRRVVFKVRVRSYEEVEARNDLQGLGFSSPQDWTWKPSSH
jgi:chemotaxis protein MotB